jgi:hypothetical protein
LKKSPSSKAWVDTRQIQKIKEEPFEIKSYNMDDVERLGMILFFSFQSRPNPAIERKILSLKKYISLHIYYYYFSYAVFVQYSPPTKGHSSYQARLQIQRDSKILNHLLQERTPLLEDHFFIAENFNSLEWRNIITHGQLKENLYISTWTITMYNIYYFVGETTII